VHDRTQSLKPPRQPAPQGNAPVDPTQPPTPREPGCSYEAAQHSELAQYGGLHKRPSPRRGASEASAQSQHEDDKQCMASPAKRHCIEATGDSQKPCPLNGPGH
jgi:hypothetical protein